MNSPVENILQNFFQTDSLQNVSVNQLQQFIADHPYFDVAHFLLAKKLYQSKEPGYEEALQKAALHFSNGLWFNYQLNNNDSEDELIIVPQKEGNTSFNETEETIVVENKRLQENVVEEIIEAENKQPAEIEEIAAVEDIQTTPIEEENTEDDYDDEIIETTDANEDEVVNEKLSSILKEQAEAFEKPVEPAEEIPIENTPYHRVDYFDSQGIKLEEDKANDKLGTQLRRFTDWLKQMKRVTPNSPALPSDEKGEKEVENIALNSNEKEEIVTETMAEVLIKQGKPEQAIKIYEKLSFINPSKSSYFAAKIEELKG